MNNSYEDNNRYKPESNQPRPHGDSPRNNDADRVDNQGDYTDNNYAPHDEQGYYYQDQAPYGDQNYRPDDYGASQAPQGYGQDTYSEQTSYEQEAPYGQAPTQPQGQTYTQTVGQSNGTQMINDIFQDLGDWFKALASAEPTSSVKVARKSTNAFTWAAIVITYVLASGITQLLNSLQWGGGVGFVFQNLAVGLTRGIFYYLAALIVVVLSQLIVKNLDRWYEPFNAAAIIVLPNLISLPFVAILGSFSNSFTNFVLSLIGAVVSILEILLVIRAIRIDQESTAKTKANEWILIGLLIIFSVLTMLTGRINVGLPTYAFW